VNRDVRRYAFLLDDHVILRLLDDGLDLRHRMAFGYDESRRVFPNVLVFRPRQDDSLGAPGIRAFAKKVVGRILLAERVGDLADTLVHVPEEGLVHRETFFLSFVHLRNSSRQGTPRSAARNRRRRDTPMPLAGLRPDTPFDGQFVRVKPIAERHREGLREVAEQEPQIHRYTGMYSLGFDRWFDEALGSETEVPFIVHVDGRPVGSTRYMNIDPFHRRSQPNRVLLAMAISNIASSLIGGLTIIPGGVKSKVNIAAGGRTLWANFTNSICLILYLAVGYQLINLIPLGVLASVLLYT